MKKLLIIGAVGTLILFGSSIVQAFDYTVTDLGTLGGNGSWAVGINSYSQVVGGSYDSDGRERAFFYDSLAQLPVMQNIGTLGGGRSCATSINNFGYVVGYSNLTTGIDDYHAFVWDSVNGMQDIGTLGGDVSYAYGINNIGQVVGYSNLTTGAEDYHAFVWDSTSGIKDIGTLGSGQSFAYSINDSGKIVGNSHYLGGSTDDHAFLYDSGDTTPIMEDIGTLGGSESFAYDINNLDEVVGKSNGSSHGYHPFVWDNNNMIDLDVDGGYRANAINDSGIIVGEAFLGHHYGFVWHNDTIIELGVHNWPEDINNLGQVVGYRDISGVGRRAYITTPIPEPLSFFLFGAGVLFWSRKKGIRARVQ